MAKCEKCEQEYPEGEEHTCAAPAEEAPAEEEKKEEAPSEEAPAEEKTE